MIRTLFPLAVLVAVGCGPSTTPTTPSAKPSARAHNHEHGVTGPSGGVIAEWGEEDFHVEILFDHTTGEATANTLDGTAKKVSPIDAKTVTLSLKETPPVAVTLDAKPQDGDPPGRSSRFVGKHDVLKTVKEFSGSISGKANGKNYTGDFEEKPAKK